MDASDSESGSELDFANFDLTGVDFDHSDENYNLDQEDASALEMELAFLTGGTENKVYEDGSKRLCEVVYLVSNGRYVDALKSQAAMRLFTDPSVEVTGDNFKKTIEAILSRINSVSEFVEAEFIAIAAFSLFLQLNYTGPMFDDMTSLDCVNPHSGFAKCLNFSSSDIEEKKESITGKKDTKYHNSVLAELAVDGMWPCQVAEAPYLLLLSRHILATLSDPARKDWLAKDKTTETAPPQFFAMTSKLKAASIWSARAGVAHERLLLSREPTDTLWGEVEHTFSKCIQLFEGENNQTRATIFLEYGLACYHFDREKIGKNLFVQAMTMSGLSVEVTGAEGKRTKFQRKATAQMVVRATSANQETKVIEKVKAKSDEQVKSQMVELSEDNILFERVKFEEESENEVGNLTVLDQAILMALCLDVKNNNPSDGLTAEEMHAYLSRVLCHHDDWMVYSTALLERAWLEFEGNHTKERAILQMQALADQHTNRLTITQSTRKSVEESSPVQDRIRNLHSIAYPPRWHMLRDVAERYASLGIVTTAAEIFTEIEYWDEVVDCYRRAGKEKRAEEIVRERLNASETPRMWAALGDITSDPKHYEKAIALSQGRFVQAYISLGNHYFEKGLLLQAKNNYRNALKLRPLVSTVWFRVGTICMQLEEWDSALEAFSEVVQQQPEEAEAWANVAAVHMHNKHPAKAFPALAQVRP